MAIVLEPARAVNLRQAIFFNFVCVRPRGDKFECVPKAFLVTTMFLKHTPKEVTIDFPLWVLTLDTFKSVEAVENRAGYISPSDLHDIRESLSKLRV